MSKVGSQFKGDRNMNQSIESAARLLRAVLLVMLVIGVPSLSFAEDDIHDEIRRCAAITEASERLSCYDKISVRQSKASEPASEQAVAISTPPVVPPEDLGANKKVEVPSVNARVNRCSKDSRKKYIFYLDGGQVWKQISDKKLNFKDCNFNVSIRKDFFGYKMQAEGSKSKFRVSRVR